MTGWANLHNKYLAAGMATAVALCIAGCSSADNSRDGKGTGSRTENAGPLSTLAPDHDDPYSAYLSDNLLAINSAKLEISYKCYAENGYPLFLEVLPAQKANAFRGDALTPDFKTTFASMSEAPWFSSEAYARETGFGHTTPARDPHVFASDGAFAQISKFCEEKALSAISGSAELLKQYVALGNSLAESLRNETREIEGPLNQKVFDCMNKGDYPVDPHGPNKQHVWNVDFGVPYGSAPGEEWPVPSKGGGAIQLVPATPELRYTPTTQESEAAAAMYRCSIESGARDSWTKAVNKAKQRVLAGNEARFSELNPQIQALAKSAAAAAKSQP